VATTAITGGEEEENVGHQEVEVTRIQATGIVTITSMRIITSTITLS
jgi:hypothetical protein